MAGRFGLVTSLGLVLASPGAVAGHDLQLDFRVLPDRKVQIEGWYEALGKPQPARGAQVKIFRPGNALLIEGALDNNGYFVFSFTNPEDLRAVVSQAGHRAELVITAMDLDPALAKSEEHRSLSASSKGSFGERARELLTGLGFLLALAAFWLSWRNAREIEKLKNADKDTKKSG